MPVFVKVWFILKNVNVEWPCHASVSVDRNCLYDKCVKLTCSCKLLYNFQSALSAHFMVKWNGKCKMVTSNLEQASIWLYKRQCKMYI